MRSRTQKIHDENSESGIDGINQLGADVVPRLGAMLAGWKGMTI
jgi:hypothetical protein